MEKTELKQDYYSLHLNYQTQRITELKSLLAAAITEINDLQAENVKLKEQLKGKREK